MDREGFRNRLQQYKLAREENPGLKYWEWKAVPKYDEGGEVGKKYYRNEVSTEDNPIYYKEQTAKEKYSDFVNKYGWTNVDALNARNAEASKYTIPYIPEKEIRLTTDRYNTGKISTNLLDSIYDSSQRVGIPFDVALGLAGRESTLGIGRGFKKGSDVTMTDLYSNWLQVQPVIASKSMTDKWNDLVRKEKRGEPLTDDDYAFRTEFLEFEKKALESTRPIKEHPIDNALKLYLTGRYNAGDKSYEQKVLKDARLVMSDPAIQKWAKEKGIAFAEGTDGVTLKEKEDAFWRGDTQKMAELVEREGKQLTYVTPQSNIDEVVITANKPKQNQYSELDFAKDVAGFVPVVGDAIDVYDAGKALFKGNYSEAAMLGAGLLLPNWIEKSGKLGYRYLRKLASKKFGAPNVEFYENLGRDILTKPKEVIAARKDGRYPLTFKERRKYLKDVHDIDAVYRDILINANLADFDHKSQLFLNDDVVSTRDYWDTVYNPDSNINFFNTFNSRSFRNFTNPFTAEGVNNKHWNINSHIGLRTPKTNILQKPQNIAGTAVHERQHSVSKNMPDTRYLSVYSPEIDYFTYRGESGITPEELEKALLPINKNAGVNDWAASPGEWLSEAMVYRVRGAEGKPFREMSESERENFINFMHVSLGDNLSKYEIAKMLADGSTLGYF